jgi:hypothetical protein
LTVQQCERVEWGVLVKRDNLPAQVYERIHRVLRIESDTDKVFVYTPMGGELGWGWWSVQRTSGERPREVQGYYQRITYPVTKKEESAVHRYLLATLDPTVRDAFFEGGEKE